MLSPESNGLLDFNKLMDEMALSSNCALWLIRNHATLLACEVLLNFSFPGVKAESDKIGCMFRAGREISEIGECFSGYLSVVRIFAKFLDIFRCFPHLVSTSYLNLLFITLARWVLI